MPNRRSHKGGLLPGLLALGLATGWGQPLAAQADSIPYQIRWYQPVLAVAAISVLFFVDDPVRSYMLDNQTASKDDVAAVFKEVGEPAVWVGVPAAIAGVGLLTKNDGMARTGLRAVTSAALAGLVANGLKIVVGRERPIEADATPFEFEPFELSADDASFPSGHTSTAFGLAASLAMDVRPTWAKVGLYTVATGTAWSRVYNNKHWFSDVVAGALVGIGSAKLVRGDWQVWGIRPPAVFTDGRQVVGAWQGTF